MGRFAAWTRVGVVGLLVLVALASLAGVAASSGQVISYPDTDIGQAAPNAAEITGVTVENVRGSVIFGIQIDRLVALRDDLGVEIVLDTDRNASTGFPWFLHDVGAEYMAQILCGVPRLLRWDSLAGRWMTQDRPVVSTRPGEILIAFKIPPRGAFDFAVSTATNMIPQPDGSFIITDSVYDFAPDHGHWRYRPTSR